MAIKAFTVMKRSLLLTPLIVVLLGTTTLFAQGNIDQANSFAVFNSKPALQNKQLADSLFLWQEQIELHLDKTQLQASDYVFFKAYLLTGPEQLRVSASKVLKVELLDGTGKLLKSQFHLIEEGASYGSMQIPKRIKSGKYYFRAYTQWMLNYDADQLAVKQLQIGKTKEGYKNTANMPVVIEAFVEGGNLVAGLTNRVVVKSNQGNLNAAKIVDDRGVVVSTITSYGMLGTTIFEPQKGTDYHIELNKQNLYKFPAVQEKGYSLQVNNLETGNAFVRIETSPEFRTKALKLIGSASNVVYFESDVYFKEDNTAHIDISKKELPKGIMQISLVDQAGNVWAQRPVLIDSNDFNITVERAKSTGDPEGAANFNVSVTDADGNPVQTSLSISLNSIHGKEDLENASFNVKAHNNERNRRFTSDLKVLASKNETDLSLMQTGQFPDKIKYRFQKGLDFYGQAYDLNGNVLRNTNIQVVILPEDKAIAREVTTNKEGLFKLSDLEFVGTAKAVFRTVGERTKEKLVKVIPFENEIPGLAEIQQAEDNRETTAATPVTITRKTAADFLPETEEGLINLDEITLVADKSIKKISPSQYGINPTRTIFQNSERPKTLPQMFLNVPGFSVSDLGGLRPKLNLPRSAGMGGLLWVLDGFPLGPNTTLMEMISIVPFPDIDRIEILLGASAAVYGSRAAAGVIILYTKNGSDEEYLSRKHTELTYNGYHRSIDFRSYKDEILPTLKKAEKYNTTLYWNPSVLTDVNGQAEIKISVPDSVENIHMGIKAVAPSGEKANIQTLVPL